MTTLTIKMKREQALRLGLLVCANCGWPWHNHFDFAADGHEIGDYGMGPCALDKSCKAYKEKLRSDCGEFV